MGALVGKILMLDFPFLVGIRTKLGMLGLLLEPVINTFTNDATCAQFPKTCAAVKTISTWLVVAGIRGAVAQPASK